MHGRIGGRPFRWRCAATGALLAFALAGSAQAQGIRAAVLPFEGAQARRVQSEIERVLRATVILVPDAPVRVAAAKFGARGKAEIAGIALELGAQVVIFGEIHRGKGLTPALEVAIHDADGAAVRLLAHPLPGGHVDAATMKRVREAVVDVVAAMDAARGAPRVPVGDQPVAPPPPPPPSPPPPPKFPLAEGAVGLLLTGRSFGFGKNASLDGLATCQPGSTSCPRYRGTIAAGLRVDLTLFPLTLLPSAGGGWRHLAGLGIGATYDFVGWPGSIDAKPAPTACGGKSTCKFGTREQRAEVGLRFRWRFVERTWSPLLITSLGYGFHSFTIDPPADGVTIVPSVTYQYVDLGVGLRLPILGRVTVAASVNGHALATAGAIRSSREYGPGGGGGVRGNLVAEARLWRSLSARLSGFYEVFWLDFDGGSMPKKTTDGTTSDAFWGLTLSAGYAY